MFFRYSTLFNLPPLIFYCVKGKWDRTQDAGIEPQDAGIEPKMLGSNPKDTEIETKDAGIEPKDAEIEPTDAGIEPKILGSNPNDRHHKRKRVQEPGLHLPTVRQTESVDSETVDFLNSCVTDHSRTANTINH
jgi:hypothetical protein